MIIVLCYLRLLLRMRLNMCTMSLGRRRWRDFAMALYCDLQSQLVVLVIVWIIAAFFEKDGCWQSTYVSVAGQFAQFAVIAHDRGKQQWSRFNRG